MFSKCKNFMAVLLAAITCACCMAGCVSNTDNGEKVDNTKAQLYVFNYDGGFGHEWLNKAKARFEEKYADEVFVEGTKGVQVWVDNKKIGGDTLAASVPQMRDHVFFVENLNYLDYAYQGYMLDISDIVEEKLTEYGETRSIAEKLTPDQQNYFKLNGKSYYGLPHYEGFNGISYDADLFDKKAWYFDNTGKIGVKRNSKNISAGVDGKTGTYDDGLPATYEQFFTLCKKISDDGMIPISWSGYYQFYFACMMTAMVADYAEKEANMFYSVSGETAQLIDAILQNGDVTYKAPTTISLENGYQMYSHEAFYRVLQFAERIINGNYYSASSFSGNCTHNDAQDNFLLSRYEEGATPIAMLVEGTWWQMEADGTFEMMENTYVNAGKKDRKIGFMPFPKADEKKLQSHQTYLKDDNYTVRFINAFCDKKMIPLAKKFLQFCCTDESLAEYTEVTSGTLGYKYEISKQQYDELSFFAQSIYDLRQSARIIYPVSSSDFFYKNRTALMDMFSTTQYQQPSYAIKNSGVSAKQYFEYVKNKFSPAIWENMRGL